MVARAGTAFVAVALAAACCLLAGCHDDASEIDHSVTGDASGVTVGNVTTRAEAEPLATAQCDVFNEAAKFKTLDKSTAVYACVKRNGTDQIAAHDPSPKVPAAKPRAGTSG
jgi:hypothetical protein